MLDRLRSRPALSDDQKGRVPPGQYVTQKWPVLHYGSVPSVDLATWDFRVWGDVEEPFTFSWEEFRQMPRKSIHRDIHCVTRWTRLDMDFEGVPIQHILERARPKPSARFVVEHAEQGYTTNLPLDLLDDDDVLLADVADGEPLSPEHGYPLRLVVPKRYFWKSAKWIRGLQFRADDQLGFWERYGYHNEADPWQEQRFTDD
ncbi:MAG: molybdopterin-dependent oxidoreductase [Chloroflexi bacterium]|nr:molybdopterin-dependent oxidoreductase [Chloroflexota bacterium]